MKTTKKLFFAKYLSLIGVAIFLFTPGFSLAQETLDPVSTGFCATRMQEAYNSNNYSAFGGGGAAFFSFVYDLCKSGRSYATCVLDSLLNKSLTLSSSHKKLSFVKENCEAERMPCILNLIESTNNRFGVNPAERICSLENHEVVSSCLIKSMDSIVDLSSLNAERDCSRCSDDHLCISTLINNGHTDRNMCPYNSVTNHRYVPLNNRLVDQMFFGDRSFSGLFSEGKIEMRPCSGAPGSPLQAPVDVVPEAGDGGGIDG